MQLLIYGPGRLGSAIATAARVAGWPEPEVVGRPPLHGSRTPAPRADVVIDASMGAAVLPNLRHALAAGNRRFVLATTSWDTDHSRAQALLSEHGAVAVRAPNLSLGAALFARLVEAAAGWYAAVGGFEPSIVEWHRRGKVDRPSGTALALGHRIIAVDPRWTLGPDADGGHPTIEIAGIRAGATPGTHLVTFDGAGEFVELRLVARERSAYAEGALAAARWLVAARRAEGIHPFDVVVDELLATASDPLAA
ncbi:MAG: dihydrodipicolinate reductase C-terminal domain-containing protein [Chloroflexota bacterium]